MIVKDFVGRRLSLLARVARKTDGHRYVTRKSVAAVILGQATRTRGSSKADRPKTGWPAKATATRLKIGCHVFTGQNFRTIRDWALGAN